MLFLLYMTARLHLTEACDGTSIIIKLENKKFVDQMDQYFDHYVPVAF